jgi:hypothetical protein
MRAVLARVLEWSSSACASAARGTARALAHGAMYGALLGSLNCWKRRVSGAKRSFVKRPRWMSENVRPPAVLALGADAGREGMTPAIPARTEQGER